MSRAELSDGSVKLVTILSPEVAQALSVTMQITGASEKAVVDAALIGDAGLRADAAVGNKIVIRRSDGDYLVHLPRIKTEPNSEENDSQEVSRVIPFKPRTTIPDNSA